MKLDMKQKWDKKITKREEGTIHWNGRRRDLSWVDEGREDNDFGLGMI